MYNLPGLKIHMSLCAAALGIAAACSDDVDTKSAECNWIVDPSTCPKEGSSDEVGDGDGDEDEDDADGVDAWKNSDACVTADGDRPRTVFQCSGTLAASISFDTIRGNCASTLGDPGWCDEEHEFGVGVEPYDRPEVMACCDAEGAPEELVMRHCAADMVEQICMSIPKRIQMLIDQKVITIGKDQARSLRTWLDNNQQECYDALNRQGDVPGTLEPASWLVNGGNNKGWSMLKNFTIHIDEASVHTASLPESKDDYITCFDNEFNNTEIFEEVVPVSPGINDICRMKDAPAAASVQGPVLEKGRVHGLANLASYSKACQEPWCSSVEITKSPQGIWTLQELEIFASAPVTVSYAGLDFEIDRAALRLYGASIGNYQATTFVIEPEEALFLISGVSGQVPSVRWARNSTPITVHKVADFWAMESFTVAHVDGRDQLWTITVPATTWE